MNKFLKSFLFFFALAFSSPLAAKKYLVRVSRLDGQELASEDFEYLPSLTRASDRSTTLAWFESSHDNLRDGDEVTDFSQQNPGYRAFVVEFSTSSSAPPSLPSPPGSVASYASSASSFQGVIPQLAAPAAAGAGAGAVGGVGPAGAVGAGVVGPVTDALRKLMLKGMDKSQELVFDPSVLTQALCGNFLSKYSVASVDTLTQGDIDDILINYAQDPRFKFLEDDAKSVLSVTAQISPKDSSHYTYVKGVLNTQVTKQVDRILNVNCLILHVEYWKVLFERMGDYLERESERLFGDKDGFGLGGARRWLYDQNRFARIPGVEKPLQRVYKMHQDMRRLLGHPDQASIGTIGLLDNILTGLEKLKTGLLNGQKIEDVVGRPSFSQMMWAAGMSMSLGDIERWIKKFDPNGKKFEKNSVYNSIGLKRPSKKSYYNESRSEALQGLKGERFLYKEDNAFFYDTKNSKSMFFGKRGDYILDDQLEDALKIPIIGIGTTAVGRSLQKDYGLVILSRVYNRKVMFHKWFKELMTWVEEVEKIIADNGFVTKDHEFSKSVQHVISFSDDGDYTVSGLDVDFKELFVGVTEWQKEAEEHLKEIEKKRRTLKGGVKVALITAALGAAVGAAIGAGGAGVGTFPTALAGAGAGFGLGLGIQGIRALSELPEFKKARHEAWRRKGLGTVADGFKTPFSPLNQNLLTPPSPPPGPPQGPVGPPPGGAGPLPGAPPGGAGVGAGWGVSPPQPPSVQSSVASSAPSSVASSAGPPSSAIPGPSFPAVGGHGQPQLSPSAVQGPLGGAAGSRFAHVVRGASHMYQAGFRGQGDTPTETSEMGVGTRREVPSGGPVWDGPPVDFNSRTSYGGVGVLSGDLFPASRPAR